MKVIVSAAVLLVFSLTLTAGAVGQEKVTICHAAGLDGTTHYVELTIAYPAVYGPAGHFFENGTTRAGHEDDYLGPCEEEVSTTTTVPDGTTTVVPTTTTVPEVTTTEPQPSTTTTVPRESTLVTPTTAPESTTTTSSLVLPTDPPSTPTELPFTGPEDYIPHVAIALLLLAVGGLLIRLSYE